MPSNLFKGLGRSHCCGHQSEDEILAALRSSTEYDDSTIFKPPANVYCCPLLTSLPPGAVLQDPVAAKGVDCFFNNPVNLRRSVRGTIETDKGCKLRFIFAADAG